MTANSKALTEPGSDNSILLATRSTTGAKLIGKQLRDAYFLRFADDAEQAWENLVEQRGISLLICELGIAIDQFGLVERVRGASDNWLAAIPILLLVSENDGEEDRELAFQKGATDFINLPFASAELSTRVRLHVNLYRQHALAPSLDAEQVTAVNLLKQLAQENFFAARVEQELSFSQRHRSYLSLCKLRLDKLKEIMSGFDKSTAISVVQATARIIQQSLRREDSLCYLGNAEFKVLFPATNGIDATAGINRVLKRVAGHKIRIGGKHVPVTLSAAVFSCIADDDTDLARIERQLDASLKLALSGGGNQAVGSATAGEGRAMSVDRALKLIAAGKGGEAAQHARALLQQVLPLLDFADETLQLGLDRISGEIRKKLGSETKK